ncbi:MAG: glycosyltransferase N-terminal domain-containing protein [Ferruginibacter sp.]
MSKLLYHLFLFIYKNGIRIAALWNRKARLWVQGRKVFPTITKRGERTVWMHCASLGEFEQGRPVLEAIRAKYPAVTIVLTFFSPSGYEIRKNYTGADYIFYLPADSSANAKKMIEAIRPSLVLWVKYEFWYYYLAEFKRNNIPVLMISGIFREDQPFFKWYGNIWRKMLPCFTHIFVQNSSSMELLNELGYKNNVTIGGDTRFDRVIEIAEKFEPVPLIEKFCGLGKVVVAGSTWEEDEAEWTHYVKAHPQIKFIIAPHEIDSENLKDVKTAFPGSLFYSELLSMEDAVDNSIHVLVIDNIGMLSRLYAYAHITFVGGGFTSEGIHNVLEAAVYGKPVIYGPYHEKFAEAVELVETGAGICINNALELEKVMSELWHNETLLKAKSDAAKQYVYSNAGATGKIMDHIQANRLLTS